MKNLLLITLSSLFMFTSACSSEPSQNHTETPQNTHIDSVDFDTEHETVQAVDVNVLSMNGPTSMGLVKFMSNSDSQVEFENNYNFSITSAIDEVTASIVKGDVDIATVPANLASVLYNNTDGEIQVLAINTLGVLYVLEHGNSVTDIESLRGKTIFSAGKGGTPEMALRYVLTQNGIDPDTDVNIEWKSEQSECLVQLASSDSIAMLAEPFVTNALILNEDAQIKLNLTEEWDKTQENSENPSTLITGVVVTSKKFANENPTVIEEFLQNYEISVNFVNENNEESAILIDEYGIIPYESAVKSIQNCNLVCISGELLKTTLEGYLTVLFDQNPTAVGGQLPLADFYYEK